MTTRRRLFIVACFILMALQAVAQPSARLVTVLSYNIHHGEGTDGVIQLERIAKVIKSVSPDFVALQEVDRRVQRSGNVDQLAELVRLTGLTSYFGKTIDHQGGEYGNAVLARKPVSEQCNVALPGREPRGLLSVRSDDGMLFLATHFDVSREHDLRLASAGRINQWIDARNGVPAILAGDLNAVRGSPAMDKLAEQWAIAGGVTPTIPAEKPSRQIDFILFRPAERWKVVEVRVLDEPVASDHRPIVAVFELK